MPKIRFLFSEWKVGETTDVISSPLRLSKLYVNHRFLLFDVLIDFGDYTRCCEMSVPYYYFKKSLLKLKVTQQELFLNHYVKFKMTKLHNSEIKIEDVKKYKDGGIVKKDIEQGEIDETVM